MLHRVTWQSYTDEQTSADGMFETVVRVYKDEPLVYFSIIYTSGLTNASITNTNDVLSTFPSFIVEETSLKRGYTTWFGGRKCIYCSCSVIIL